MIVPYIYHILMVSYGWTIDYINDCVTIAQIVYLLEIMKQNPPATILSFGLGQKNTEGKLMRQIDGLGDKVKVDKWFNKPSVKSVIRLRDKAVIK